MARRARKTDTVSSIRAQERLAHLRERVLKGPCTPTGWRLLAFCQAALEYADGPVMQRRAAGLARTARIYPAIIHADELIVGTHHFGEEPGVDGAIDFPEMHPEFFTSRFGDLEVELEKTQLHNHDKELIRSLRGRAELFVPTYHAPLKPAQVIAAENAGVVFGWGLSLNHSVRDFAKVLRMGFEGIEAQIQERLAELRLDEPDDLPRLTFLSAAQTLVGGCKQIGVKYATEARHLAEQTTDPLRRAELTDIAEICEWVPAHPARTFREAIQALWFAHILTCAEDHINANSIGRIDQLLGPYYDADLAAGRIDEADALELLQHLWLKLWRAYDVQQMQIGGVTCAGDDATNAVSYLALRATEELNLVRCLSVRVHRRTPRRLLEHAVDLVSRGGGVPFFFNDEAVVPALVAKGFPVQDARNYAVIGCVEVTIPGKASPHAVSHQTNLAKCLELALHDGRDPRTGIQAGPHTGPPLEFRGVDDLWSAYTTQVEHAVRIGAFLSNAGQLHQMEAWPLVYCSVLTDDCIARGKDINAGGAVYNFHSASAVGIPNVADSIRAVEKLVFEERQLSMAELLAALATNFESAETIRKMLLNRAEKYGNDCPAVDRWAARVAAHFCHTMGSLRTWFGGSFHVHLFSFLWNVEPFGAQTGALPDGRRAGEPLAYSLSATAGRDRQGLTAFLNSLAKIPHHLAAGGSSAIVELSPDFFRGRGKKNLIEALKSAVAAGVGQLQINVVSAERLRQAQEDPERYGNIVVRVAGFSQEFRLVPRHLQDHIIERVKHVR